MDSKGSRRRIQKNLQNNFSRKRKTIFRKIHALYCLDNDLDMYFVLRRRGRLYTYASSETASWPPTKEQIVSHSLDHNQYVLISTQDQSYPIPVKQTPADFFVLEKGKKNKRNESLEGCEKS